MFQQMQSGDEGPAIYEMFAGPIFENVRVSRCSEEVKERKLEGGPTKKVKRRPLKPVQSKLKRSPVETTAVSGKSKAKPVPSRLKSHLTMVPRKDIDGAGSTPNIGATYESLPVKDVDTTNNGSQDELEVQVLPTIEETPSRHRYEISKSNDQTLITQKPSYQVESYSKQEMTVNTSMGNSTQHVTDSTSSPSPPESKINTWTSSSSSCHSILSPVYQKFLDESGDGPLTDDLLQCLAEELISLDEKDVSTGSENNGQSKKEFSGEKEPASGQNILLKVSPL